MKIAKVVFDIALDREFDYLVPPELADRVHAGSRVTAGLGRASKTGVVLGREAHSAVENLKEIAAAPDGRPLLDHGLLELGRWMAEYWVHPLGRVLCAMVPAGVRTSKKSLEEIFDEARKTGTGRTEGAPAPELTAEQRHALGAITPKIRDGEFGVFLLHGVTGSGKTEVYMRAIAECLARGRQAIVMVPEISLTPQMQERFEARFPGRVSLFHSRMTERQRRIHWARFACGEADIAVGARSVVFAPAGKLGLIVVDEEHERSFKQEDGFKYHARDAAVMRGKIEKVPVILGSATPSIESYANCIKGKYALLPLTRRVEALREPRISFVDMATERDIRKRGVVLSRPLVERVGAALVRGEQVLLFLNRRGYSTASTCPHCGWQLSCLHCSIILTYHKTHERAYCHICGYSAELPAHCPECGAKDLDLKGVGTQQIEALCRREFPAARIRRIDTDSVKGGQDFETVYRDVLERKIDILVGTQMLAKGLHFPHLTLAGVVSADTAMRIPDFRASETTIQTVFQVAGRVGRSEREGEVVVQTDSLDSFLVNCVLRKDYEAFVRQELEARAELGYPPFEHFVRLVFSARDEKKVQETAGRFYRRLKAMLSQRKAVFEVTVPTPAVLEKRKNEVRWHLLVKTRQVQGFVKLLRPLVFEQSPGAQPARISVDVDPFSML